MSPPEAPRLLDVVDVLRSKIVSGEYPEGAKLPGETPLARYLQASRSTVRRALVELAREGLVSAARGKGTFVRVRADKCVVLIGSEVVEHEDLLDATYEPSRRGWTSISPTKPPSPRIVRCNAAQARVLSLNPQQPILLREQNWRHQEHGYVIALSSFAPTKNSTGPNGKTADAAGASACGLADPGVRDPALGDGGVGDASVGCSDVSHAGTSDPVLRNSHAADSTPPLYPELIRDQGPVTFSTSVSAYMPSIREREDLEVEPGVPLLVVTRTMLDPSGRPLEVTIVVLPADRFEVAHRSRNPVLSL